MIVVMGMVWEKSMNRKGDEEEEIENDEEEVIIGGRVSIYMFDSVLQCSIMFDIGWNYALIYFYFILFFFGRDLKSRKSCRIFMPGTRQKPV